MLSFVFNEFALKNILFINETVANTNILHIIEYVYISQLQKHKLYSLLCLFYLYYSFQDIFISKY